MATVMKEPVRTPGKIRRTSRPPVDQQLRRDRITAIVVIAIFALVLALTVWLVSFGSGVPTDVEIPLMMP